MFVCTQGERYTYSVACSIQVRQQRSTGVCLVQCSGQRRCSQPGSIIFEINKFLIGLQWGKEQQPPQGRAAGQRVEDDTNRSISSIEEDFMTASEHLGDDSEDDGFRNGEPRYLHRGGIYAFVCHSARMDFSIFLTFCLEPLHWSNLKIHMIVTVCFDREWDQAANLYFLNVTLVNLDINC